jgi:hypothetical protein
MKRITRRISHAIYIGGDPENVDLVFAKVYRVLPPARLDRQNELRVIDESGEDYLYPADWFVPVEVPFKARRALAAVS